MIINFVGLFNKLGYVGEVSDETHIARELESLGHTVQKVPRDIWKAYVDGERNEDWEDLLPIKADINIIAKWPYFNDGKYVHHLRDLSWAGTGSSKGEGAPVFYWVWDYMPNPTLPDWHIEMAKAADLYLSGEAGIFDIYKVLGVKPYYFQMDVCDGDIKTFDNLDKVYDVVFTGSCIDQGHRKEYLQEINKQIPVSIFAWNPEEWFALGFKECYPPVYGEDYNKVIAQSKIVLGLSVEPNCLGYWSNRVGKVLRAKGQLLQEWAPGMETLLPTCIEYFSTPQEAVEKIKQLLTDLYHCSDEHWESTSRRKAIGLVILMERYLKGDPTKWLI